MQGAAASAAAAMLTLSNLSGAPAALAGEFDILAETTPPPGNYILDDAGVLSKATRGDLTKSLSALEVCRG